MPPQLYVSILSTAPGLTHARTGSHTHCGGRESRKQLLKRGSPAFLAKPPFHRRQKLFPARVYPCSCTGGSCPGLHAQAYLPRPTCPGLPAQVYLPRSTCPGLPAQAYLPRPICQLGYRALSSQLPRSSPPPSVRPSVGPPLWLPSSPTSHL